MEYIAKLIDSLAWPAAVVWLGYLFKNEAKQLLSRMSHLKYKDVEAKFDKELEQAEKASDAVSKAIPKQLSKEPADEAEEKYSQLLRIMEVSPRAAIMEAWIQIEVALAKLAGIPKHRMMGLRQGFAVLNQLINENKLPQDSIDAFHTLRKLRNDAAHLPDFAITQSEAERYIESAAKISHAVEYYASKNA